MNLRKERWKEWDGHIITERTFHKKFDSGVERELHGNIAFNVGSELARHIVTLHNRSLE